MKCPICDKALSSEPLHGHAVERCSDGHGCWLSEGVLGRLVRQLESTTQAAAPPTNAPSDLPCPSCGSAMSRFNYSHDSGVLLQRCHRCGGVWLLPGQLEQLIRYRDSTPAIRALDAALVEEAARANHWGAARDFPRSRLLSGIVAATYVVFVLSGGGGWPAVVGLAVFLLLPMSCIWFPDALGNLTGVSFGLGRPSITHSTPADFVAIGGWILLLCPLVLALFTGF